MTLIIEKPTGAKLNLRKTWDWNETIWNPSMISTALWLDAADASTIITVSGNISQWSDKSGNNRHATQATANNRPTYNATGLNNKGVVTFTLNSSNVSYLLTATASYRIGTFSYVGKINQAVGGFGCFYCLRSSSATVGANSDVSFSIGETNASNFNAVNIMGTSSYAAFNGTQVSSLTNFNNSSVGSPLGSDWYISVNSPTTTVNNAAGTKTIGLGVDLFVPRRTESSMSEIIITPDLISTATQQRIEGYLAHKWGLEANLPSNHPYKTLGPTP